MKNIIYLILSLTTAVLVSCNSPTSSEGEDFAVIGKVLDPDGNPVVNAIIRLSYLPSSEEQENIFVNANSNIPYNLAERGAILLWISSHSLNDTLRILVDQVQSAGSYAVLWDGTNSFNKIVLENIYDLHLATFSNTVIASKLFTYDYTEFSSIEHYQYHDITDNNGNFDIKRENLVFLNGNRDLPIELSQYVNIWALHNDFEPVVLDSVLIESQTTVDVTLRFVK